MLPRRARSAVLRRLTHSRTGEEEAMTKVDNVLYVDDDESGV